MSATLNDHIIHLIVKKLKAQAGSEELKELDAWRSSAKENEQAYKEFLQIWQSAGTEIKSPGFNTDAAWRKIHAGIQQEAPTVIYSLKRIAVAAAVLLLVAGAYYWWTQTLTPWNEKEAVAGNESVRLPEGTTVLLRKGSSIGYPELFEKNKRVVKLSGEAFFDVRPNEKQPFYILTRHAEIKVLGTSFLMRSMEQFDELVVTSGKVSITENGNPEKQLIITAGQRVLLKNEQFERSAVMDSNYIAWQTGLLNFKNALLSTVLEDLSHYYAIPVVMETSQARHIRVTAQFKNQPLNDVLDEISLATGLDVKKEAGQIVFYQK